MDQNCPELHSSLNYSTCYMGRHTQENRKIKKIVKETGKSQAKEAEINFTEDIY